MQAVYAQHGRVANEVQVSGRRTVHGNMKDLPLEGNAGRVTERRKEG